MPRCQSFASQLPQIRAVEVPIAWNESGRGRSGRRTSGWNSRKQPGAIHFSGSGMPLFYKPQRGEHRLEIREMAIEVVDSRPIEAQ